MELLEIYAGDYLNRIIRGSIPNVNVTNCLLVFSTKLLFLLIYLLRRLECSNISETVVVHI